MHCLAVVNMSDVDIIILHTLFSLRRIYYCTHVFLQTFAILFHSAKK